jgi:predicted enzyme related to lactoylglutathione lyase
MTAEAVLYVKDLARMVAFYEQCFGFSVARREASYAQLRSDAWTLVLVSVPAEIADTITITVPPRRRADVPLKLAFQVPSLEAGAVALVRLGGYVDAAARRWSFGGFVRCDAVDPEGNVIQLLEPSRGVAVT